MFKVGCLNLLLVVTSLFSMLSHADDSKRDYLKKVAAKDRNAFYTLLDIDSWCQGALSTSQLAQVTKQQSFADLAKLRAQQNTDSYYDRIYTYHCPGKVAGHSQVAVQTAVEYVDFCSK